MTDDLSQLSRRPFKVSRCAPVLLDLVCVAFCVGPHALSSADVSTQGRLLGIRTLVLGGGGDGIGRGICEAFGAEGAIVAVADLDPDRAATSAAAIRHSDGRATALSGDVRDPAQLGALFRGSVEALGGLDALVTVVGGQVAFVPAVKLHEMADADWDTMYELNLRYVARAVREALRIFLGQGTGGSIVSIGSVTGVMAAPRQGAYGVMKAGLLSLARTVGAEYAADGIRMNVVAAGAVATAVANAAGDAGGDTESVDEIPMGRYGSVVDVAQAAIYLVSHESDYVTGQGIIVDGGVTVRGPFG